jgi:hypothetical protein
MHAHAHMRRYNDLAHTEEGISKVLTFMKNKANLSAETRQSVNALSKVFKRVAALTDKASVACGYRCGRGGMGDGAGGTAVWRCGGLRDGSPSQAAVLPPPPPQVPRVRIGEARQDTAPVRVHRRLRVERGGVRDLLISCRLRVCRRRAAASVPLPAHVAAGPVCLFVRVSVGRWACVCD